MITYPVTVVEKKHIFANYHYEFIKNKTMEERSSMNSTNDSVDTYDYHPLKSGEKMFKKMTKKFIFLQMLMRRCLLKKKMILWVKMNKKIK